jgi:hypothetical protein
LRSDESVKLGLSSVLLTHFDRFIVKTSHIKNDQDRAFSTSTSSVTMCLHDIIDDDDADETFQDTWEAITFSSTRTCRPYDFERGSHRNL